MTRCDRADHLCHHVGNELAPREEAGDGESDGNRRIEMSAGRSTFVDLQRHFGRARSAINKGS